MQLCKLQQRNFQKLDELAPNAQQSEADDISEGSIESEKFVPFNPDRPIVQREYDIGADIGITSTRQIQERVLLDCQTMNI